MPLITLPVELPIATVTGWEGQWRILGVDLADRENRSTRGEFLSRRRTCGAHGWSTSSSTTARDPGSPSGKCFPRRRGSAATCTSSATRATACASRIASTRNTLSFAKDATEFQATVPTNDDQLNEGDGMVRADFSLAESYQVLPGSTWIRFVDDEAPIIIC